jgi:predicted DNA-binding protein YlxM (UPF0122 family)
MTDYTTQDIVKLYNIDRNTVRNWVKRGLIKPYKYHGRMPIFDHQQLKRIDAFKYVGDPDLITTQELYEALGMTRQGLIGLLNRFNIEPVRRGEFNRNYYPKSLIEKIERARKRMHGGRLPKAGRAARIAWAKVEGYKLISERLSDPGEVPPVFRFAVRGPDSAYVNDGDGDPWFETEKSAWDNYIERDDARRAQAVKDESIPDDDDDED